MSRDAADTSYLGTSRGAAASAQAGIGFPHFDTFVAIECNECNFSRRRAENPVFGLDIVNSFAHLAHRLAHRHDDLVAVHARLGTLRGDGCFHFGRQSVGVNRSCGTFVEIENGRKQFLDLVGLDRLQRLVEQDLEVGPGFALEGPPETGVVGSPMPTCTLSYQ